MARVKPNAEILRALVRMEQRFMPTERARDLIPIARRRLRGHAGDDAQLLAIYRAELARLEIRRRSLERDQVKLRPLIASELGELAENRAQRRYLATAIRRTRQRIRDMRLSPKQREMLARAVAGVDKTIPERWDPGPPPFVMPERRWHVPPGYIVVDGSAEYAACRVLKRRGLLRHDSVRSESHPNGLGGYAITAKGRRALA